MVIIVQLETGESKSFGKIQYNMDDERYEFTGSDEAGMGLDDSERVSKIIEFLDGLS